jgi:hypothetical protein
VEKGVENKRWNTARLGNFKDRSRSSQVVGSQA